MTISGGMKFFDQNKSLGKDGSTIVASTGQVGAAFALDINRFTKWVSVGSDDTTTETLEITFSVAKTIDRLIVQGINWKQFQIKRFDGSGFVDFVSVVGLDGDLGGGISETAFSDSSSYYEFDSVSTTKIKIFIDKTQIVDAEKECVQFIATTELGTFIGYPTVNKFSHSRNIKTKKALSGKLIPQKSFESSQLTLMYRRYPESADIALITLFHDRDDPFLVWACGGRRGSDFFDITQRGWALSDIYNMQMVSDLDAVYDQNIYTSGVNGRVQFAEVIA